MHECGPNVLFPPIADIGAASVEALRQQAIRHPRMFARMLITFAVALALSGCASTSGSIDPLRSPTAESLATFERNLEDAVTRRDLPFLSAAYAPTVRYNHHGGLVENRAALLNNAKNPPSWTTLSRRVAPSPTVELHGDVGLTRGSIHVVFEENDTQFEYDVSYVRIYRWTGRRWQLLSHHTVAPVVERERRQ